jgi:rare lipoprotein A
MYMKYILIMSLVTSLLVESIKGTASYYSDRFQGRKTTSGQKYNKYALTAASNKFNLGDTVRVTNLNNSKSVIVVINDRMANNGRIIDVSKAAADSLDFIIQGLAQVKVERV